MSRNLQPELGFVRISAGVLVWLILRQRLQGPILVNLENLRETGHELDPRLEQVKFALRISN